MINSRKKSTSPNIAPKSNRNRLSKESMEPSLAPRPKIKLIILLFVSFSIGISYVVIRMKGVEADYTYNEYYKQLKKIKITNKELKAQKAKVLSVKKLRQFAKNNNLNDPSEKQIIVVP